MEGLIFNVLSSYILIIEEIDSIAAKGILLISDNNGNIVVQGKKYSPQISSTETFYKDDLEEVVGGVGISLFKQIKEEINNVLVDRNSFE